MEGQTNGQRGIGEVQVQEGEMAQRRGAQGKL